MSRPIPKFSELPLDKSGPHHNAWGLYGPDDELGTLNRLTDNVVREAAQEIQSGVRINLDWPLDAQRDLPFFERQQFHKHVYAKPPRIVNDDVWTFNTQSSSQWDGLRHFAYQKEAQFYNGATQDTIHGASATDKLGVGAVAARGGIAGRGLLIDFAAWAEQQQPPRAHDPFATTSVISRADLDAVLAAQGVTPRFGDILLIRSGYMRAYARLSRAEIQTKRERAPRAFAGIEQSEAVIEFLWENFAAAAADHPALEAWPSQKEYALHEVLLAGWGMPIGELFDLEQLAEHCRRTRRYTFFFVSKPNYVPGGVASPPNAVAIF